MSYVRKPSISLNLVFSFVDYLGLCQPDTSWEKTTQLKWSQMNDKQAYERHGSVQFTVGLIIPGLLVLGQLRKQVYQTGKQATNPFPLWSLLQFISPSSLTPCPVFPHDEP